MAWLAADATRATASWDNEGNGELTWIHDGQRYQVEALARRICTEAGIAFPDTRPGPHWWLDPAQDNKSLVQISGG